MSRSPFGRAAGATSAVGCPWAPIRATGSGKPWVEAVVSGCAGLRWTLRTRTPPSIRELKVSKVTCACHLSACSLHTRSGVSGGRSGCATWPDSDHFKQHIDGRIRCEAWTKPISSSFPLAPQSQKALDCWRRISAATVWKRLANLQPAILRVSVTVRHFAVCSRSTTAAQRAVNSVLIWHARGLPTFLPDGTHSRKLSMCF